QDMIDRAGVLNANGTCYPSILPQRTPGGKCKNGQIYGLTPASPAFDPSLPTEKSEKPTPD
ncbi:MAG TPA: hypothetical protein VMQ67_01985, partial [Candidatus Saccharimonadales bacterium]|nr:hypothetical protein [Candidatus Saccharimonadales bacterium]